MHDGRARLWTVPPILVLDLTLLAPVTGVTHWPDRRAGPPRSASVAVVSNPDSIAAEPRRFACNRSQHWRNAQALRCSWPCRALRSRRPRTGRRPTGGARRTTPTYAGYSGRGWDYDYGVQSGACDRGRIGPMLGGVVGGVAGGAIGAEVGKGSTSARGHRGRHGRSAPPSAPRSAGAWTRPIARASATRSNSPTDGQSVQWTNPNTRVTYQLTPARRRRTARRLPTLPAHRARRVRPERGPHDRLHRRRAASGDRDDDRLTRR